MVVSLECRSVAFPELPLFVGQKRHRHQESVQSKAISYQDHEYSYSSK